MADKEISTLTAASAPDGTELVHIIQGGNSRKATLAQIAAGHLIGKQVITATGSGTYTPTSGTTFIILELQAAGGGGGAVPIPGSTQCGVGGGGSGGGWLRKKLTTNFSGATYSVGAKGTGGAAGANSGSNGGDTTFTDTAGSPTTYTAHGGTGGGHTSGVPTQVVGPNAGGAATQGDDNRPGGMSMPAIGFPGPFFAYGGPGGDSMYSSGAIPGYVAANPGTAAGVNANGKGGGGSGAAATGTGAAAAGGDGTDGVIVIWEYA